MWTKHDMTLLKIKVFHDAIEKPILSNGSIKNLTVSQKHLCGDWQIKGCSDYIKVKEKVVL